MTYASAEALCARLEIAEPTTAQIARATQLLAEVEADIDHVAGQSFAEATDTDLVLDGPGASTLLLPCWPVLSIAELTADDGELVDGEDYKWSATGVVTRKRCMWPCGPRSITVTYSHGYAQIPAIVVKVELAIAAILWSNPGLKRRENIGDYGYEIGASPEAQIDAELRKIKRFTART